MNFTLEQKDIIEGSTTLKNGQIMKVNACAGSGKTSTCVGIANANSEKRILYLVFNKNMEEEAKKKFPNNVVVRTVHSLAYLYTMAGKERQLRSKDYNIQELYDLLVDNKIILEGSQGRNITFTLKKVLEEYYNSDCTDVTVTAKKHGLARPKIAADFLNLMVEGKVEATHSAYLKEFHQLIKNDPLLLSKEFDMLMLDEAQDTNPVTWAIIKDAQIPLICVGDTNQNIYGFRATLNVMENIKADKEYMLTGNFRSSQDILNIANSVIEVYKGNENYKMLSMVGDNRPDKIESQAIITRTNAIIIELLIDYMNFKPKSKICLPRGVETVFEYAMEFDKWAVTHKVDKPAYKWLEKFKSLEELKAKYLDTPMSIDETELKATIQLFEKFKKTHGNYNVVREAYKFAYAKSFEPKSASTINILTAHSSKGLEYDRVTLTNDYKPLIEIYNSIGVAAINRKKNDNSKESYIQEVNLAYVAYTRAKKELIDNSRLLEGIERFRLDKRFFEKSDKEQTISLGDKEVVIPNSVKVTHKSKRRKLSLDDIAF